MFVTIEISHSISKVMLQQDCYTAKVYIHMLKSSSQLPEGIKYAVDTSYTYEDIWRRLVKKGEGRGKF